MTIDLVLIVGASNSGKSTLVRCLSGIGRGRHQHPSLLNIALLDWGVQNHISCKTMCLISSLNEGKDEDFYDPQVSRKMKKSSANGVSPTNTVSPLDLEKLLDTYSQPDNFECKKAILCISTSTSRPGWRAQDYENHINNKGLGSHTVIHCISLGQPNLITVATASPINLRTAPFPRNAIAAQARLDIGLR